MQRQRFLSLIIASGSTALLASPLARLLAATVARPRNAPRSARAPALRLGVLQTATTPGHGLEMGVAEAQHAARLLAGEVTTFTEPITSTVDDAVRAAARLVERDHISVLLGGEQVAVCHALADFAATHDVLYFNTACSEDALRGAACERQVFHVAPSDAMRRDALAAAPPASTGTQCVAWSDALVRYGADTLNTRFRAEFGEAMTERAWAEWFAVKVVWETCLRARSAEPAALLSALERSTARFDGHKGRPLSFRAWDHQLRQPLYLLPPAAGGEESPIEVPAPSADSSSPDALDMLGARAAGTACHWQP